MEIEQFVMAYSVEQDRFRALLPDGFSSLRPVLRINAELRDGKTTRFLTGFLDIRFTGVGIEGGCPAEKDNAGCFFLSPVEKLRPSEPVTVKKEFCDCTFRWRFAPGGAHGVSIGKTLPAYPSPQQTVYPRIPFTAQSATQIPCRQVLGSYAVRFER